MTYLNLLISLVCIGIMSASLARAQDAAETPDICKVLPVSIGQNDNAKYIPNFDIDGNAVVPAEVESEKHLSLVPEVITIPVTIDVAQVLGLDLPEGPIPENASEFDTLFGTFQIYRDTGRVVYNEQDVTVGFSEYCQNPDRQPATDDLGSDQ